MSDQSANCAFQLGKLRIGLSLKSIAVCTMLGASSFAVQATDSLNNAFASTWLPNDSTAISHSGIDRGYSVHTQLVDKASERPGYLLPREQIFSSLVTSATSFGEVSFAATHTEKEFSTALAASVGRFSFSSLAGRGEAYARTQQSYYGMDPYLFHGGNLSDFSFSGHSIGYSVTNNHHLQFGQTKVQAAHLEDRKASYIDYSNNRLFARLTQVDRGSTRVGYGVDLGIDFGRFDVAYQSLSSRYDVSSERIKVNWYHNPRNRFGLEFSKHDNSLLSFHSDSSMMLSWHHTFGKSALISYASEAAETKPKGKINRGVLIGGAATAAALLLSSGSDSQDSTERSMPTDNTFLANIQAQHDSARQRLNEINPRSVRENVEFGGYIYQMADGSYSSTTPVRGEAASVTLPAPSVAIPAGTRARASYHTHAGPDPRYDNENFSPTDLESDRDFNMDGYLGTPGGLFKYHNVATGEIQTLGTINN